MATVGIGIITYRGHHRVLNLLESIRRRELGLDRSDVVISVYDDGSPEGIPEQTKTALYELCNRDMFADAYIFGDAKNHGIAYAWNRVTEALFHRSQVDRVILLNDDVLVVNDWLGNWSYFVEHNPHAGQVGLGFYWFDPIDVPDIVADPDTVQPRTHDRHDLDANGQRRHVPRMDVGDAQPGRVVAAPGCSFGFSRAAWDDSNGFPEDFISFHEESITPLRRTVVLNRKGFVSFPTFEDLFDLWQTDAGVLPNLKVLASSAGFPVWDTLRRVLRHPTRNRRVFRVITKEGETEITEDHSLMMNHRETTVGELKRNVEAAMKLSGVSLAMTLSSVLESGTARRIANEVVAVGHVQRAADNLGISREHVGVALRKAAHRVGLRKPPTLPDVLEHVPTVPKIANVDIADWLQGDLLDRDADTVFTRRRRHYKNCDAYVAEPTGHSMARNLDANSDTMLSLMRLLAAYVTEGNVWESKESGSYGVVISNTNFDLLKKWQADALRVFQHTVKANVIRHGATKVKRHNPAHTLTLTGNLPRYVFSSLGGRYSANKRLPDFVFSLPESVRQELLQALLDGDGFRSTKSKRPYAAQYKKEWFTFTTTSELLACQVSFLCKQLCMSVALRINPSRGSYDVRSRQQPNTRCDGFRLIERNATGYVYDLETAKTHTFVDACGLLVLHNSHHGHELTAKNRPGYVLTHPMIWHQWSATFRDCPELKPSETMRHSRRKFCGRWEVPVEFGNKPFDYTHPKVMSKVPAYPIKWLSPTGPKEAVDPACSCVHCKKARGEA